MNNWKKQITQNISDKYAEFPIVMLKTQTINEFVSSVSPK